MRFLGAAAAAAAADWTSEPALRAMTDDEQQQQQQLAALQLGLQQVPQLAVAASPCFCEPPAQLLQRLKPQRLLQQLRLLLLLALS